MSAALKLPSRHMTVAEFLEWARADHSPTRWQLCDGEPEMMAPPSERHGRIQGELATLIGMHFRSRNSPCSVVITPGVVPRVRSAENYRIPDLAVSCSPVPGEPAMLDPIVLIEILSPSNETETLANIWTYTSIPSVTEIVIIRSDRIEAEILRRQPDQSWPSQPELLGPNDELRLPSIGFTTPLREAYRTAGL